MREWDDEEARGTDQIPLPSFSGFVILAEVEGYESPVAVHVEKEGLLIEGSQPVHPSKLRRYLIEVTPPCKQARSEVLFLDMERQRILLLS